MVDWVRTGRQVTGGGENMVPYYYLAGAVGFTTGMANLTLSLSIRLHNDAIKGRMKQAVALKDKSKTLTSLRQELGTPMVKAGLEMMGLAGGPVRSTGARLDATDRKRVRKMLKQKSILESTADLALFQFEHLLRILPRDPVERILADIDRPNILNDRCVLNLPQLVCREHQAVLPPLQES